MQGRRSKAATAAHATAKAPAAAGKRRREETAAVEGERRAVAGTAAPDGVEAAGAQPQAGKPNRPPTAFEERLYELCKSIPEGKVSTYGAMAEVLGSSARAVGQGMRRNPFAPVVPCHRVIAHDLDIGGFSGAWGPEHPNVCRKLSLLKSEGVEFNGSKVASPSFVLKADELRRQLGKP